SAQVEVFAGDLYEWATLKVDAADEKTLERAGLRSDDFIQQPVSAIRLQALFEGLLVHLENHGYPFAQVQLDSVSLSGRQLVAKLNIRKGPLYTIDSIRNQGSARISTKYLQRYFGILSCSPYKSSVLQQISVKVRESPFLQEQQPWEMVRLNTGAFLNLYLEPRKTNQLNVLIGLLPATQVAGNYYEAPRNKFQFTGDANIRLNNALGNGETIGVNWQQLQVKSPRLNLLWEQPYLFGSSFGMKLNFDLLKKDTSFVNINMLLGATYSNRSNRSGTFFVQWLQSNVVTLDTQLLKLYRRLPPEADLRSLSLGVSVEGYTTDYRLNPLSGNEWQLTLTAGTKVVKKNPSLLQLKDPSDPSFQFEKLYDSFATRSYQFRLKAYGAHFFRLAQRSTLKWSVQGGWFQSPFTFRNELFQIGGYKLLRGFDEESIYASHYGVTTLEFRYLMNTNSYFFVFVDAGWASNHALSGNPSQGYAGAGLGLTLQTTGGVFTISLAAGKRNDLPYNIRQTKVHLGYISYF
ncbi:MAG: ShlB/FhaC/HecB family hemolysin secretion/activation protein, partial [Chitinophagaceae bacterium]